MLLVLFEVYGIADYTNRIEIGFGMFFCFWGFWVLCVFWIVGLILQCPLGFSGFWGSLDCRPHTPVTFGFFLFLNFVVFGVWGFGPVVGWDVGLWGLRARPGKSHRAG